jgi:hypothetical protein
VDPFGLGDPLAMAPQESTQRLDEARGLNGLEQEAIEAERQRPVRSPSAVTAMIGTCPKRRRP